MIEFLLSRPKLQIEAEGETLATLYTGKFRPEQLVSELQDLVQVRRLIPDHLGV
ncbi:MAG: hypothetical protein WA771_03475 [Chthoniobacterales bacterium]